MSVWQARRFLPVLLLVLAVLTLASLRASNASGRELRLGREAERAEDLEGALVHYRRAASWAGPWLSPPAQALASLQRVAALAREAEDSPLELKATRAWFSALQSRRVVWVASEADAVASRLAALSIENAPAVIGDGRSNEQRRAQLYAELRGQQAPRPLGLLLTLVGLVCWVSAAFLLPVRGLDLDLRPTPAARGLGTWIVLGFGLFVLGLALA